MRPAFDRAIRQVQWRCHLNLLLEQLMLGLLIAGSIATAGALAQKIFAVNFIQYWMVGALAGLAVLIAAAGWVIYRKDRMAVAIYIDDRLHLRERFSTALALHDSNDPFAVAACAEAHQAAQGVLIQGQFPIRLSRRWMPTLASWLIAAAVFFFLPALDVLGYGRQEQARQDQIKKVEDTKAEVKKEIQNLTTAVNKMGDKDLAAELAKLEQATQDILKPEDIKPGAIKKLDDITQQLENKNADKINTAKDLENRLKRLTGSPQGLSPELNKALASSDFKKAADIVKEMQRQLDDKNMTPEQQAALKSQLENLAQQLENQAKKNKDIEDQLAEAGLNKDAANLDQQQLRDALAKQGLTQEQIDKLMQDLANSKSAQAALRKLAGAMRQAGESGMDSMAGELDELSDQLTELEAQLQDAELAQVTLNECKKCLAKLGQCQRCGKCAGCQGNGQCTGIGDWQAGDPVGISSGTGGPGIGWGKRPSDDKGDVSFEKTKADSPTGEGPAIASSFVKGSQVTGESTKKLQDIVQAGKEAAAEAISENQIPRKYENSIKGYFDEMGNGPGKSAGGSSSGNSSNGK